MTIILLISLWLSSENDGIGQTEKIPFDQIQSGKLNQTK